tara:strand:+ start:177 stop:416 length:240 start_codon:yes stop_codon:yes gene_type:complete
MVLQAGYGCDPLPIGEDASQNTSYFTKMCGHDVSVNGTQGETEYIILLEDIRHLETVYIILLEKCRPTSPGAVGLGSSR